MVHPTASFGRGCGRQFLLVQEACPLITIQLLIKFTMRLVEEAKAEGTLTFVYFQVRNFQDVAYL